MFYLIWLVLLAIAVTDARDHLIPNKYLLIFLCFCSVDKLLSENVTSVLIWSCAAGFIYFSASFIFYLLKTMAPGDVKLLGCIGFWVGWGQLTSTAIWIAISGMVVGIFYTLIKLADEPQAFKTRLNQYRMLFSYGMSPVRTISSDTTSKNKWRMPFAPIVVIGVALTQYVR